MVRVLLCGEVRGRVRELHRVLQQLQNKGPFDFALCSGSFFADPHDSEAAAACKDSSTQVVKSESSDLPEKADQSDVARAVRAELSQQFAAGFAELQHCCSSLPLPLYILDRAASECAQRLSARVDRGGSAVAVRSGEAAPERTAKEESAASAAAAAAARPAAAADSPSGNASDVLVEKNGQNEEKNGIKSTELSPAQPQAPPRAPRCTYSPLQLLDNVWLLAGAGVAQLEGLNVAFYTAQQTAESPGCNSNGSNDQQQQQQQQQQHENGTAGAKFISSLLDGWGGFRDFRGSTDLFVTTEPLLGMFDGLPPGVAPARFTQQQQPQQQQQPEPQQQQPEPQQQQQQGEHAGLESNVVKEEAAVDSESPEFHFRFESSCLADFLEPRHIICSGLGLFWQRPFFRGRHFGYTMRLISLGVVGEKGPHVKAFHALQLRPTTAMLDLLKQQEKQQQGESEGASRGFKQEQQQQQQAAAAADAVEEARAALFFVPIECNSPNPFICAVRQRQLLLHSPPPQEMWAPVAPGGPSPSAGGGLQGPPRPPKRPRETGVVLVENLPFELTEEGPLKKALERFGAIKFIFMPKDKTDPTKGTGKAYVVYFDPKDAASATEASGQLEGGGRSLRLRLYYDKIPFDRPTGAKSIKCGSVIATEPHADCWFCLANPQVEKHMIVDIADRMYTAVPKGGLTPLHMLLIPIAHLPSLAYADAETRREAAALIRAARTAFHQQNLDLVVYERYVPMKATKAMHSQLHAIPCDRSQALQSGELFEKRAKRAGLSLQKLPETADITSLSELANDPCLGYFYVEVPGVLTAKGQTIDRYLHVQPGRDSGKIPMTFGREVMAELLGLRDKVNWQACLVPKDEEAKLAAALRDVLGAN